MGVSQTIHHESDKTRGNELSQTIIQLLEMKKQVENYNDDLNLMQFKFSKFKWEVPNETKPMDLFPTDAELLFLALEEFREKTAGFEFKMLQASIAVDVETYQKISERTIKIKLANDRSLSMLTGEIGEDGKRVKFGTFKREVATLGHDASTTIIQLQDFLKEKTDIYMQEYEKLRKK